MTNAVVGEADGAAVLVELTPTAYGDGKAEAVRLRRAETVRRDEMKRVN